jgi:hypothetical protein
VGNKPYRAVWPVIIAFGSNPAAPTDVENGRFSDEERPFFDTPL